MLLLLAATPATAQVEQLLRGLGGLVPQSGLSEGKIASGLKEALQVGTQNAVNLTSKVDGYFGNQAIKIPMPEKLRALESGLRAVGYGPKVDEFVLSMNRAAEGRSASGVTDVRVRCRAGFAVDRLLRPWVVWAAIRSRDLSDRPGTRIWRGVEDGLE
jgi:hypothetical protein